MRGRHRRGDIRLRSNVVLTGDENATAAAWKSVVPGEIVHLYKPHLVAVDGLSQRQRDERGYYLECVECHRLAHEIGRDGCTNARCIAPPSDASVAAAHARHEDALQLIAAEREHLEAKTVETEREELRELLDPEAAVARYLGLAAIGHAGESESESESGPEPEADPQLDVELGQLETRAVVRAKRALVVAAAETGRFLGSYCESPLDNLVDTLTLGQTRAALAQIGGGDGAELKPRTSGSAKFCASYSSAALAVNTFAAWMGREPWLILAGRSGFTRLEFEVKFPTGLQGKSPNLDVVATGSHTIVAVESKCIEYLGERDATFQPSYDAAVEALADESWTALFHSLRADSTLVSRLGVGQLVRHYLGLRRAIADGHASSATLLYLYWEPANAAQLDDFLAHRRDVVQFARRVADPTVEFVGMSYPELWAQWTASGAPEWLIIHVAALRERYAVTLK